MIAAAVYDATGGFSEAASSAVNDREVAATGLVVVALST